MSITLIHKNNNDTEVFFNELVLLYKTITEQCTSWIINDEHEKLFYTMRLFLSSIDNYAIIDAIKQTHFFKIIKQEIMTLNQQYFAYIQVNKWYIMIQNTAPITLWSEIIDLQQSKQNELSWLDLSNTTWVCIQWWVLLETANILHNLYENISITCIEKNYETMLLAQLLLSKSDKSNNTSIIYTTTDMYDFSEIDRVYIPNLTENKTEIIQQIQKTAKSSVKIFVQFAKWLSVLLYENYDFNKLSRCNIDAIKNCERKASKRELHTLTIH